MLKEELRHRKNVWRDGKLNVDLKSKEDSIATTKLVGYTVDQRDTFYKILEITQASNPYSKNVIHIQKNKQ